MTPEQIAGLPYRPCAGVCLTNPQGRIWVGERIDRPAGAPVAWQMPQGGIDPGETPEAAALRELREETGLAAGAVRIVDRLDTPVAYDLPPELVPTLWKGRFRGQEQHWFRMHYDGPDSAVDLDAHEREFSRWAWMDPADVVQAIVPFKRDLYERVLRAFGLL
ncbi:RNA pyrophosphohydrolase [Jannaschia sp. S6380]|uniref:RNA pyrophosphohydrolase n=1 Tax=Jannaschia sp. S6380 TaxID=2926408 RepID=UPI001FF5D064|nr:RNA pyrophosphohydrolase [Jannaschia sp. S6380]MCK0168656.1 RNA pyrophosphohydrolase [Jannaschia sp. S6380]